MPSATSELRAEMDRRFGDPIDDTMPISFLVERGYRYTRGFEWLPKPGVKTVDDMEQDEYDCLLFLIQEWDWGGLREPAGGNNG